MPKLLPFERRTPDRPGNVRMMNHRHEAILNWLILNPHRPLGECARELGYTQGWVSLIVHSDMFQAIYRAKCLEMNEIAVHTIANRLSEVSTLALQKTREHIESGKASERFLTETAKNSLAALGYGPKPQAENGTQKHLHVHVDAQTLIEARERAAQLNMGRSSTEAPPPSRILVQEPLDSGHEEARWSAVQEPLQEPASPEGEVVLDLSEEGQRPSCESTPPGGTTGPSLESAVELLGDLV